MAAIRLDVSPRECVVEQYQAMPEDVPAWKTMSTTYTVRQMAALLDAREHDALVFLSNVVRICRDLIARRAAQSMPALRQLFDSVSPLLGGLLPPVVFTRKYAHHGSSSTFLSE